LFFFCFFVFARSEPERQIKDLSQDLKIFIIKIIFSYNIVLLWQLKNATESLREKEQRLKESEEEASSDLENALIRLEEEQQR